MEKEIGLSPLDLRFAEFGCLRKLLPGSFLRIQLHLMNNIKIVLNYLVRGYIAQIVIGIHENV